MPNAELLKSGLEVAGEAGKSVNDKQNKNISLKKSLLEESGTNALFNSATTALDAGRGSGSRLMFAAKAIPSGIAGGLVNAPVVYANEKMKEKFDKDKNFNPVHAGELALGGAASVGSYGAMVNSMDAAKQYAQGKTSLLGSVKNTVSPKMIKETVKNDISNIPKAFKKGGPKGAALLTAGFLASAAAPLISYSYNKLTGKNMKKTASIESSLMKGVSFLRKNRKKIEDVASDVSSGKVTKDISTKVDELKNVVKSKKDKANDYIEREEYGDTIKFVKGLTNQVKKIKPMSPTGAMLTVGGTYTAADQMNNKRKKDLSMSNRGIIQQIQDIT